MRRCVATNRNGRRNTPAQFQVATVSAPEPTAEGIAVEAKNTLPTEEEQIEIPQTEPLNEDIPEPEPAPGEMPVIDEMRPMLEPEPAPAPEPTPVPTPSQTVADSQPGDMVCVPSFDWLECQGLGEVIYDESISENGNKIGIMG